MNEVKRVCRAVAPSTCIHVDAKREGFCGIQHMMMCLQFRGHKVEIKERMVSLIKTVLPELLGGDPEKEMECACDRISRGVDRSFERYPVKQFPFKCPWAEARGLKIASCFTVIILKCIWRRDEPVGHCRRKHQCRVI
jgi:hypothetical protein